MGFDRASGRKAGLDQKKTNSRTAATCTNPCGPTPVESCRFPGRRTGGDVSSPWRQQGQLPPSRSGTTCSWTLHTACLGSPFEMMSAAIFSGPVTWTALSEWNQGVGRVDNPERIWTGKALACTFWHSDTSPESKHDTLTMWPHRRKSSAHALHKVHA